MMKKHRPGRADQPPGRCRAGEELAWRQSLTGRISVSRCWLTSILLGGYNPFPAVARRHGARHDRTGAVTQETHRAVARAEVWPGCCPWRSGTKRAVARGHLEPL